MLFGALYCGWDSDCTANECIASPIKVLSCLAKLFISTWCSVQHELSDICVLHDVAE